MLKDQVLVYLKDNPRQKAQDIALALGADRSEVNRLLYGVLKGQVEQDNAYRWSIAQGQTARPSRASEHGQFANTDLAKLSRYYLACLGFDETGVSTFLTSKYGDPDYIELNTLPAAPTDFANSEPARRMLGRKRTEQGRYGLYFGYLTYLRHLTSRKSSWEGFVVEPLLLFPIEEDTGGAGLIVDLSFPIINQKPFKTFSNVEREMLMQELVQLEQELGLASDEGRIELDEIAMRLQSVRPEWPWKEDVDPDRLAGPRPNMASLSEEGIYNRAVIVMAEKSPFTQGLETELRALAQLPPERIANTALGAWLSGKVSSSEPVADSPPLLEVLPMNLEQRQAVNSALNSPVTVITGPPGTGKSQVVTNMLVNAAWSGKRVLFASKNNKAVDVVETRVNALGSRPALLRMGASTYRSRLAQYMLDFLSATTTPSERESFAEVKSSYESLLSRYKQLDQETERLVDLRNKVDRNEQQVELARDSLYETLFKKAESLDFPAIRQSIKVFQRAINEADKGKASPLVRLIWPLIESGRFRALAASVNGASKHLADLQLKLPKPPFRASYLESASDVAKQAVERIELLEKVAVYRASLRKLQEARSLEDIARDEAGLLVNIAKISSGLWQLWLRIQPSNLSAAERQKLSRYKALLQMVLDAGDEGQLNKQTYTQYAAMMREVSHLLPCWAVTSLSARGRIPFEPGMFDIVVFDEASQCDIASALPLLYRAKSVVIIGDPKQLAHISGLRQMQDQNLLERFGLIADFPHWAYSYQSLFDLGATLVSGAEIVSLVDHHRSHADIINFSNEEFYEQRLRVATNYDSLKSPNRKEPGIRWVDVRGHVVRPSSGGALNHEEAQAVVDTLRDLILAKGYAGSIGVVTPFRAQANAITEAANRDVELSNELVRHGFLADTVHKFQGDERDVMLFSPVVSGGISSGASGFLRTNGNLFNVAITRARAQLIVVGDKAACGNSDVGYLSRFASYATGLEHQSSMELDDLDANLGPEYPVVARPEAVSDWEREFYVKAYQAGFRLIPQYPIEKYVADFLFAVGERKLVIEVDGERYHRNWTGELCRRDQIRNQRMFELGYDVMRFWVYEVRDDIDGCLKRINKWKQAS